MVFELVILSLKVKAFYLVESLKVITRYYLHKRFALIDLRFRLAYAFLNPFRFSRRFLQARGAKDLYTYGETPLTTLEQIATQAALEPADCVFELGCGRGLGCFWLRECIGCSVVGIEIIPLFVRKAKAIQKSLNIDRLEFREDDFFLADLTGASVIYLYGTSLEPHAIEALIDRFRLLPEGAKIITVSYPLSDFTSEKTLSFPLLTQFSASFPWGEAEVFVQYKP